MRVTVYPWERALVYRRGSLSGVLGPGAHRLPRWRTKLVRVDGRTFVAGMPLQELLSGDGLGVKASASMRLRVVDPVRWQEVAAEPKADLHDVAHAALRAAIAARTLQEVVAARTEIGHEVGAAVTSRATELGAELLDARLKDLAVPAELRQAFAAQVIAREGAKAALEQARGEVAATRALLNVARQLEEHPALIHLRTLQVAAAPGTTVVLKPPPVGATPG